MRKILITLVIAAVCFGPAAMLLGIGLVMNPAAQASCLPGMSLSVGPIPDSLAVTTKNGERFTLNRTQLTHAATIITIGGQTDGIDTRGVTIALMAALTESTLRQLANTGTYPESGDYPNDGNGSDHDSLGLFQMRPQAGWGTVADLMDTTYQARAFYGGPAGPNYPSPRGLLDIPGWQQMDMGEAAQAVEVSAYPDRYQNYQPVAEAILTALTRPARGSGGETGSVPETSRIVFPLPAGTWTKTSEWGWRSDPFTGERSFHSGSDYGASDGTPIYAVADGHVLVAEFSGGYGGLIVIEHTVRGQALRTAYAHMWAHGIHVTPGQTVTAGTHIGDVGSSGRSTGAHLHLEVRPGSTGGDTIDADAWLAEHGATEADGTTTPGPGCAAGGDAPAPGGLTGEPDAMVDDPTSSGQITVRMSHVMTQTRAAFPDTGWGCYSPRPGTTSEHPLGRACDVTFGNSIGQAATGTSLENGWAVTNWLKTHAEALGVEYLIWQGQIWSLTHDPQGWRPYNGGGMHNPTDVTGGHFDHLHITVKQGA
ncbi:peptidase M23-like protein [Leucobacter komagatae]|uniref:Peptidase M23-like protein n=1 Tax=Leucobacter komagatae TaxID=55969 RepID=A0A542Y3E8_9MICO|nr:peptidase M23-like protein [Leucobacter komagatae]